MKYITKFKHLILWKKLNRDKNQTNKSAASNVGFTSIFVWKPNLLPTPFTQDNEIKKEKEANPFDIQRLTEPGCTQLIISTP